MSINKNLHLHAIPFYQSLPTMIEHLPMVEEWLARLHGVIHHALNQYGRVFAFRVDLRFPDGMACHRDDFSNAALSKFWDSLRLRIKSNRANARLQLERAHDSDLGYFWVREIGMGMRVHYHLLILVNGHAFSSLGDFQSSNDNMFNRLSKSWASALGISVDAARPLLHFPEHSTYRMARADTATIQECFRRSSYLCKVDTKAHGFGHHSCGSSRYLQS